MDRETHIDMEKSLQIFTDMRVVYILTLTMDSITCDFSYE